MNIFIRLLEVQVPCPEVVEDGCKDVWVSVDKDLWRQHEGRGEREKGKEKKAAMGKRKRIINSTVGAGNIEVKFWGTHRSCVIFHGGNTSTH